MKSSTIQFRISGLLAVSFVMNLSGYSATVTKSGSGTDLALGTSWAGAAVPGSGDVATWIGSSLGGSLTLGSNVTWSSINISGALSDISISGLGSITTGNIVLSGNRSLTIANNISLSAAAIYTIADVTNSTAVDATLSGIISGAYGFTKSGDGTLTLAGANAYTGGTTLNGGTLVLDFITQNNDKIAAGAALTFSGGNLSVTGNSSAATTQSVLSTVLNSGSSNITLTKNAATHDTTLHLNTITRSVGTMNIVYAGSGSGTANLTTDNTNTNGILGAWATVAGSDWASNSTNGSDGRLVAYSAYSTLVDGATSDTLNPSLTGTLSFTGAHTHNSLKLASSGSGQSLALGANLLTLNSGGLLATGSDAYAISGNTGVTGLTAGNGSGAYDLIIHQYNSGGLTISAVIGNNGSNATRVTKVGTGTLTLSGINTYTGGTTINAGTLSVGAPTALPTTGGIQVGASGTLELTGTGTVDDYNNPLSGSGIINLTGTHVVKLNAPGTGFTGTINVNLTWNTGFIYSKLSFIDLGTAMPGAASTINVSNGSTLFVRGSTYAGTLNLRGSGNGEGYGALRLDSGTISGAIHLLADASIGSSGDVSVGALSSISGNIDGAYALTKINGNSLILTGSNSYSGGTTISGGSIVLAGGDNRLATTGVVAVAGGAKLVVGNTSFARSQTLAGLTGAGSVVAAHASNSSVLTLNIASGTNSFAGVLGGTAGNENKLALIKSGAGVLELTGASTFTGGTTISEGSIVLVDGPERLAAAGVVDVASGAKLVVGNMSAARTQTLAGLTGLGNVVGAHAVDSSLLILNIASGTNSFVGVLGGSTSNENKLRLTKSGAGVLALSGANTYTGATTISAGTLSVGTTSNLGGATSTLVFDGGTLQITGSSLSNFSGIGHSVSFTAAKSVGLDIDSAGHTFTVDQVLNQTTGGFTKAGAGTVIMNQSNTFTGPTAVNQGKLLVSGSIGASDVTVSGASTVLASGATGTIGKTLTVDNGAIVAAGDAAAAGTATVLGAATFNNGSIFSWDINGTGAAYDKLIATGVAGEVAAGDAIFRIVVADTSFANAFWTQTQTWGAIFTTNGTAAIANWADLFSLNVVDSSFNSITPTQGSFSLSGNTLTWTAVPEPSSAFAGILLGMGLLRRRRNAAVG